MEDPEDLDKLRNKSNHNAREILLRRQDERLQKQGLQEEESKKIGLEQLLSSREELYLLRIYLVKMKEFCQNFQLPIMRDEKEEILRMDKSVIATAFIYMKRFYLNESCMEHHPRNIGVTCAYLACKVDEFNVSIDQFIRNVQGNRGKAQQTVLSNELLVMKKLRFHLTVHLPFRAVQGFLIDLRARYPPAQEKTGAFEPEIDEFLEKSMFTDACFLYTPSQIALAAVCYGAERCNVDMSKYLSSLFADDPDALDNFRLASRAIKNLIEDDQKNSPSKDVIKRIDKKLEILHKSN